ncbi:MAG: amidohydrolase [Acidobacteriota bacterium]
MKVAVLALMLPLLQSGGEKRAAFRWVDENSDTIERVNREIWSHPELALREYQSSRILIDYLKANGFRVEEGVAGLPTAFVANYGQGKPVIAIYGEYDALPGLSQGAKPLRSALAAGGAGHGCGHSLFGTASATAAIATRRAMEAAKVPGTIRFYGTPAEESIGGKNYMLEAGLFDDADILLGWHAAPITAATFQYTKAIVSVRFKFKGLPAHASTSPHLGRSALDGVELMNVGVNYMREHVKEDARIHYVITNGGGQPNVVPGEAESWYYIRADKHRDVEAMFEWIQDIARAAAQMTRTQVEISVADDSHETLPNRPLSELIDRNLRLVGPPRFTPAEKEFARKTQQPLGKSFPIALSEKIRPLPEEPGQGLASTDVGNVSWKVPTGRLTVASYSYGAPGHSWQIVACSGTSIGQKAIAVAAKALAASALDLLQSPSLIEAARRDFQERKKGYDYRLLLPPHRRPPVFPQPPATQR